MSRFATGDRVYFRSDVDRSQSVGTVVSVKEKRTRPEIGVVWDDPRDNDEGKENDPTYVMLYSERWLHHAIEDDMP